MAGLLDHTRSFTAICNPLVNSYKRLASGFERRDILWAVQETRCKSHPAAVDDAEIRSLDP